MYVSPKKHTQLQYLYEKSLHLDPVECVTELEEELLRLDSIAESQLAQRSQIAQLAIALL